MFLLLIRAAVWLVRAILRSRSDLVLEKLALRQQLAIFKDKRPQPRLTDSARAFWVGLPAAWPRWLPRRRAWSPCRAWVGFTIGTSGAKSARPPESRLDFAQDRLVRHRADSGPVRPSDSVSVRTAVHSLPPVVPRIVSKPVPAIGIKPVQSVIGLRPLGSNIGYAQPQDTGIQEIAPPNRSPSYPSSSTQNTV